MSLADEPTANIPDSDVWHDANSFEWPVPWQPITEEDEEK